MTFTTPEFMLFVLLFFWAWTVARGNARKWVLLGASYLFYASWNPWFLVLIIGSTIVDFYVGGALGATDDARRRKRLLWLSLVANLGTLAVFKYFDFFVASAVAGLQALGIEASASTLGIILPVGISFYTFQTMSYTIDIYRRQLEPTPKLLDFALFVAFFPQLVAGPIERATHLLPQIVDLSDRKFDSSGFGLIALGCFKKAVIADNLGTIVELTYADPSNAHGWALWIGTYAFAVQIYCDFSGYSDIAVGFARLLGIDLVQNFRAPYASQGPTELWRRWHISLSTWLRDYLYIPLGGSRGSNFATMRNLMLTMLLGGLWHGAAANYLLWGAFHGGLLAMARPLRGAAAWMQTGRRRWWTTPVRRIVFFHLICLGWVFFRAQSLEDCGTIYSRLFIDPGITLSAFWHGIVAARSQPYIVFVGVCIVGIVGGQMIWPTDSKRITALLWRTPEPVRFTVVLALLYLAMNLSPERPPPFIYFQF